MTQSFGWYAFQHLYKKVCLDIMNKSLNKNPICVKNQDQFKNK